MLYHTYCYGQTPIRGYIKNEAKQPLGGASIQLIDQNDIKKAAISDKNGFFQIDLSKGLTQHLKVSFLSYLNLDTIVEASQNRELVLILKPAAVNLDSVSITSPQRIMSKKMDRIVYRVENVALYTNKSVSDILKTIPRLNVTRSSIEIKGAGTAAVMIDERLIYLSNRDLMDYLEIYKNDIVSIEVIPNPPAKFDAQGAGLINIVTKRNKIRGLFGYLSSGITKNSYLQADESVNLSFRSNNLSLTTTYTKSFGAYKETVTGTTSFFTPGGTDWSNLEEGKNKYNNDRFNITGDYQLRKNTKLYASYGLTTSNSTANRGQQITYLKNHLADSAGISYGDSKSNGTTNMFNAGINSIFGKQRNSLDITADYINRGRLDITNLNTVNLYPDFLTPTGTNSRVYSFGDLPKNVFSTKADLVLPSIISKINMELGVKYTVYNNQNITDYDLLNNNQSIFEGLPTEDNFSYNEKNVAAYLSVDKTTKKWSTKLGIRYEKTITSGQSLVTSFQNNFSSWFPSAFVQYKITDMSSIDLAYTKRIIRPSIYDINPFKFYTSVLFYYVGNPKLLPSIQNNLTFNVHLRNTYLISAYFNHTKLPIVSFPSAELNTIKMEKVNNGRLLNYGLNFDASFSFSPIFQDSFGLNAGSYNYDTDFDYQLGKRPINISMSTFHAIQIDKSFSADINFSATLPGGGINIAKQRGYSSLDLGLNKSFKKNKVVVTLTGQDVLQSNKQGSTTTTSNFQTVVMNYYDFRAVSLTVKYKFGKALSVVRKKRDIQEFNRLK